MLVCLLVCLIDWLIVCVCVWERIWVFSSIPKYGMDVCNWTLVCLIASALQTPTLFSPRNHHCLTSTTHADTKNAFELRYYGNWWLCNEQRRVCLTPTASPNCIASLVHAERYWNTDSPLTSCLEIYPGFIARFNQYRESPWSVLTAIYCNDMALQSTVQDLLIVELLCRICSKDW